jgi:hypothetical protein
MANGQFGKLQRKSIPTSGNVLPPSLHYLALLIYASQPFSNMKINHSMTTGSSCPDYETLADFQCK